MRFLAITLMALALTACDATRASSDAAANNLRQFSYETGNAWRDVFTFRPRPQPNGPQTRFCYQMQSDVVCYDTPQTHMTSKLVGYQDGDNISYIQKGGGSLGVSTPPQTTVYVPAPAYAAPVDQISVDETMAPMDTGSAIQEENLPAPPTAGGYTPFSQGESPYVKGN